MTQAKAIAQWFQDLESALAGIAELFEPLATIVEAIIALVSCTFDPETDRAICDVKALQALLNALSDFPNFDIPALGELFKLILPALGPINLHVDWHFGWWDTGLDAMVQEVRASDKGARLARSRTKPHRSDRQRLLKHVGVPLLIFSDSPCTPQGESCRR